MLQILLLFTLQKAFAIWGGLPMPAEFAGPAPVVRIQTDINCSAVILDSSTLVTAAHCTESVEHMNFEIHVADPDSKNSYVTKIKDLKRHPQYQTGFRDQPTLAKTYADVAVLHLEKPLPFAHSMAILPHRVRMNQEVAFWLVANGSTAQAPVSRNQALPTQARRNQFKSWEIKASVKQSGPCAGDSGGGYFRVVNNQIVLLAIQSTRTATVACDDPQSISFAVDIQANLSWIESSRKPASLPVPLKANKSSFHKNLQSRR